MEPGWQMPFPALLDPVRLIKRFSPSRKVFGGEEYENKIYQNSCLKVFLSYSITLSPLLSVGLMGAFCSGCVQALNQDS